MIEYEIIDPDETSFEEDLLDFDHRLKNLKITLNDLDDEWINSLLIDDFEDSFKDN